MKRALSRMLCHALAASLILVPFQAAQAGMIATDPPAAASTATVDRNLVLATLARTDITRELQSLGVDPQAARDRVAALSDAEAATLAGQLHALPAGGTDAILALLVAVGILIYYLFGLRDQK